MSKYKYYMDNEYGEPVYRDIQRNEPIYTSPEDTPGWPECIGFALIMGVLLYCLVWMLFIL